MTAPAAPQVADLLGRWMPSQRWFAGKGRDAGFAARLLSSTDEDGRLVQIWLADVTYADGGVETYQVPLVLLDEASEALAHVYVGSLAVTDSPDSPHAPDSPDSPDERGARVLHLYDALHDKTVTGAWIRKIRDSHDSGALQFLPMADPADIPISEPSIVLTGEQSNTSLVFGDAAILKVFRRLDHGENPDVEIHRALGAAQTGEPARHLARMLGYIQSPGAPAADAGGADASTGPTGDAPLAVTSLAMLQQFMTSATDGWELAKTSVRDLMAEADLHAEEAGGDFAAEAHRLGVATAQVHEELVRAFGARRLDAAALHARADAMRARLALAIQIVPALAEFETGLRAAYEALGQLPDGTVTAHRVHGDLHLGQTLRTSYGWMLLDFEGEPVKPIAERREPDSPVRDVAGMLRSFDYVAHHQLIELSSSPQSQYRATEWATRNRDAFTEGYQEASDGEPIDPVLLRAYEADKAVYEAVYEARNRPTWLAVPLASLARLVSGFA